MQELTQRGGGQRRLPHFHAHTGDRAITGTEDGRAALCRYFYLLKGDVWYIGLMPAQVYMPCLGEFVSRPKQLTPSKC